MTRKTTKQAKEREPKIGRPEIRVLKIDTTPEFLAKCVATPIKKPKK